MFADLGWAVPRTPQGEHPHQAWISPETWILIDTRIEAHRRRDQQGYRALFHAIKVGHQGDRQIRVTKAESAIEALLASDPPLIRKSWIWMRGCYNYPVDRPPPPSRVALATMTAERENIYRHVPPQGEPIPVGDLPFSVDDDVP